MLGEILGGYRIVRLIGSGGMGQVYEAVHLELGRRVALKMIAQAEGPELALRLEREARVVAQLHHPNIVQVQALHLPQGEGAYRAFLVMDYAEGETLEARLRRVQKLPAADVRRFAIQIASALAFAHARLVLHRDVKPANIMLTRIPGLGEVARLLDFGVAQVLDGPSLTLAGARVGTPKYMSPEQALGQTLTPATDLFALGGTLFQAWCGPAAAPGVTFAELATQLTDKAAPSDADDPELMHWIKACLAKDPTQRPTADVMATRLSAAVAPRAGHVTMLLPSAPAREQRHGQAFLTEFRPGADAELDPGVQLPLRRSRVLRWFAASILVVLLGAGVVWKTAPSLHPPSEGSHAWAPDPAKFRGTSDPDAPREGARPVDVRFGGGALDACARLSSGEVWCWSGAARELDPSRVADSYLRPADEILLFTDQLLVLRRGTHSERWRVSGASESSPERRRSWFAEAPVDLGELTVRELQREGSTFTISDGHVLASFDWNDAAPPRHLTSRCRQTGAPDVVADADHAPRWAVRCEAGVYLVQLEFVQQHAKYRWRPVPQLQHVTAILELRAARLTVRGPSGVHDVTLAEVGNGTPWSDATPLSLAPPSGVHSHVLVVPPTCGLRGSDVECTEFAPVAMRERAARLSAALVGKLVSQLWSSPGATCALVEEPEPSTPTIPWSLLCVGGSAASDDAGANDVEFPRPVRF